MKKHFIRLILVLFALVTVLIICAYAPTWGKTEIVIRIHINEELVYQSSFGESPTFAIWLEDPASGFSKTVFATRRAAEGDWEGKAEVPVALPMWFEVSQLENAGDPPSGSKQAATLDASSGATPEPGYFIHRVGASTGSKWILWMEVNLAGDFNESYKEYNEELHQEDEYKSGQPALLYRAELEVTRDFKVEPELVGMTVLDEVSRAQIETAQGITTAAQILDEITISVARPKPRLIKKKK